MEKISTHYKIIRAIRELRRELLLKDEPLKAYNLLKEAVKEFPELKDETERTKKMVAHIFNPKEYRKIYGDDPVKDISLIEPEDLFKNPAAKYARYEWITEEIKRTKPASYLDLACYAGTLVLWAASQGIKATGVEITKAAAKTATERAKKNNLPVRIICGDLMDYHKKADIVSAFEVIEHIPDDNAFIRHVGSLANKWVYISTPNGAFDNGKGNLGHWEFGGGTRGHVRVYNKKTLTKLIENNGGVIDQIFIDRDKLLCAKFKI